jgi:hypothetical protein
MPLSTPIFLSATASTGYQLLSASGKQHYLNGGELVSCQTRHSDMGRQASRLMPQPADACAGNTGTVVADLLLSAGYRVSAWTRSPKQKEGVHCFWGLGQLQQFAAQANVVVCLVPLTPETRCERYIQNLALLSEVLPALCF